MSIRFLLLDLLSSTAKVSSDMITLRTPHRTKKGGFNICAHPFGEIPPFPGAGHVAIGYHLAKELNSKGHEVTILQNCDVDNNKVPFSSYSSLDAEIVTMPFDDDFEYPFKAQFDFVFDNNSKSPDGPVESALLAAKPAKQRYTFVGSAGIYEKPSSHPHNIPLDESMPTNGEKGKNEQAIKMSNNTSLTRHSFLSSQVPPSSRLP